MSSAVRSPATGARRATAPRATAPAATPPTTSGAPRRRFRFALWLVTAVIVGLSAFTGGLLVAPADFTLPPPPKSALLLDGSGRLFATIRSPEVREEVKGAEIPQVMRQAMVAAEDERFFDHQGVDPAAVLRAAYGDLTGARIQGGSTITQQYVKNVYVGNQRTALRKIREAALAVRLEHRLTKSEILTDYLNGLYLGNGTYGVQAASKYYFGSSVQQLNLSQAAMLAGLAPAPSVWNPVKNITIARQRQLYTLNRMVANGFITPQQASDAYRVPPQILGGGKGEDSPTVAPEYADMVKKQLKDDLGEDQIFRGGLRVTTTLDLDLQNAVVQAVQQVLPADTDPQAAVVAIDPRTGNLKALTTKVNNGPLKSYQRGGFNLAVQAARPTGSTIKPFTLAAALEAGKSVDDVYFAPTCIQLRKPSKLYPDGYRPCNTEPSETGSYTLRKAMEQSINTVYVKLADDVGQEKVRDVAVAAGLGPAKGIKAVPALGLGTEATPLSMAQAFATLANHGVRQDVRTVLGVRSGGQGGADAGSLTRSAPADPSGKQVIPAGVADTVAGVLEGVVSSPRGTGYAARQPFPVFGKTGTAQDFTNAWFVGCTPELCIATWMGYEDQYLPGGQPHEMKNVEGEKLVYGGTLPAKIFATALANYRALTPQLSAPVGPTPATSATARPRSRRTVFPLPLPSLSVPGGIPQRSPTPGRVTPSPSAEPVPSASPTPAPTQRSRSPRPSLLPSPSPTPPLRR